MNTINNVTSSPDIQPAATPLTRPGAGAASGVATDAKTTNTSAPAASNASGGSSVTTISTISTQLQAAQAATASDAVFSTSKVNEIKQAISEGRFQVNAEKVANGLLDSVSDLLGSRQRS